MADSLTISGLGQHVSGTKVSAFIGGLDCGDYTVDDNGTITVPFGSDPNGLFNVSYLASISQAGAYGDFEAEFTFTNAGGDSITVNVPVVIGFSYTSTGKMLRPATADQGKSAQGPLLGKTRRNHQFAVLLLNSQGVSFGSGDLSDVRLADFRDAAENKLTMDTVYTGVYHDALDDDYSFEGGIGWQISRPYPCTVTAVAGFMETSER